MFHVSTQVPFCYKLSLSSDIPPERIITPIKSLITYPPKKNFPSLISSTPTPSEFRATHGMPENKRVAFRQ